MSDNNEKGSETAALVAEKTGEAATAGALEVFKEQVGPLLVALIGGTAAAAAGAALPPIAGLLLGSAVKFGITAWTRRGERWWKSFMDAYPGLSQGERERLLREGMESEERKRAVFHSVRALLDALDDAVAEPLGRLAAEYHAANKPADWFFRGMTRMLGDLSGTDFVSVRMMLRQFVDHFPDGQQIMEVVQLDQGLRIERNVKEPDGRLRQDPILLSSSISGALRFFALLKQAGLARDNPGGILGMASGPQVIILERDTLKRIVQILG